MLTIPARAKINLCLDVVSRRPDGWHDIDTLLAAIDWHDLVGVELGAPEPAVRVTGPAASGVPRDGDSPANLAVRAAAALPDAARRIAGREPPPLRVWLDKHLPAAAGLGGGSADAAAVLRAGAALLVRRDIVLGPDVLERIAGDLGSDVPALLAGGLVRARGRGDALTRLAFAPLHLVVTHIASGSTPEAYAALRQDEMGAGRVDAAARALDAGSGLPPAVLGSALEPAALRANPDIAAGIERLRDSDRTVAWHMTGSGGAYFTIVGDAIAAAGLANRVREAGFTARACRTVAAPPP